MKKGNSQMMRCRFRDADNKQPSSVWKNRIKWIITAVWMLYCVVFYEMVRNGLLSVCNLLFAYRGRTSGRIILPYEVTGERTCVWFLGAVAGLVVVIFIHGSSISRMWNYYAVKYAALLSAIALSVGFWNIPGMDAVREWIRSGAGCAMECVDDIRYGTNEDAGLCSGKINNASRRITSEDTMLKVAMSHPEGMYLRGFCGAVYEDSRWKETDTGKLYEDMDLFYWLHHNGWYGQTQLASFSTREQEWKENIVQVQNIAADRRYIYFPYETTQCAWLDAGKCGDENICSGEITGCDSYTLTALSGIRTAYPEVLEQNGMDNTKEQKHYSEWVYDRYMDVPEDFQKQFQSILERPSGENIGICEAKQLVLKYLKSYMIYDEQPGKVPDGKDALLYYMTGARKGYDVQFASIATLMMRYLGIPARYVEGWLVTDSMVQGVQEGQVLNLTGAHGHAWTEIYVDGVGFVPFEATQSYRDSIAQAQEPHMEEESDSDIQDVGDNPGQEQSGEDVAQEPQPEQNGGSLSLEMEEKEKQKETSFGWICLCIIACIIVVSLLIFMIIWKIRKRRHLPVSGDRSSLCQVLFAQTMALLLKNGFTWDIDDLQHNIGELKQRYTEEYAGSFMEMWNLHERIRFGGKSVSKVECEQFRQFYEETKCVVKGRNRRRKETL